MLYILIFTLITNIIAYFFAQYGTPSLIPVMTLSAIYIFGVFEHGESNLNIAMLISFLINTKVYIATLVYNRLYKELELII